MLFRGKPKALIPDLREISNGEITRKIQVAAKRQADKSRGSDKARNEEMRACTHTHSRGECRWGGARRGGVSVHRLRRVRPCVYTISCMPVDASNYSLDQRSKTSHARINVYVSVCRLQRAEIITFPGTLWRTRDYMCRALYFKLHGILVAFLLAVDIR